MDGMMRMKGSKGKKGLITKTWERCKSIGRSHNYHNTLSSTATRSRSWPNLNATVRVTVDEEKEERENHKKGRRVAPEGCFSVYVGAERQKFVIKAVYANHPLFKMLLEEAELEYGYSSQGPLALPCNVDIFYKVLAEMDHQQTPQACASLRMRSPRSYHHLSPSPI